MAIDRVARDKNQEQDARLDKLEECAQIDAETISDLLKRVAFLENAQTPTPEPTPTQKGISVGGDFQNWSSTDRAKYLDAMKAAGCNWIRVDINYGGPNPGSNVADEARRRGMKALTVLIARGKVLTPAEMTDWIKNFLTLDTSDAVEVWNEPNLSSFWGGQTPNPEAYAALYNAARQAVKAKNPNLPVISGGLSPAPNSTSTIAPADFLKRAMAAGMQPDAIGWHPYTSPAFPNDTPAWSSWEQMRQTPTYKEGRIPFWLTEYGAPTGGTGDAAIVSEDVQGRMIAQAFATWPRAIDGPLFIYQGRDKGTGTSREDHYGLLRYDWTPKPAYDAFKGA